MRAEIKICIGGEVEALINALLAEVNQPAPERGMVNLSRDDGCLMLYIEARDLSSLRALVSSYLYLIHAAYSTLTELRNSTQ